MSRVDERQAVAAPAIPLPATLDAPGIARHALAARCVDRGLDTDSDTVELALLVVSELVTNALLHASGPYELVIELRNERAVRVSVADGSPDLPTTDRDGSHRSEPGGWGLDLVARWSVGWGVVARGDGVGGKIVWADLPL